MTHTLAILLAPAVADPGNLTPDDLAQLAGIEPAQARRLIRSARRRSEVAPSLLRLAAPGRHALASFRDGRPCYEDDADAGLLVRVLAAVESGPATMVEAARMCDADTPAGPSGAFKRAVETAEILGLVTAASGVLVTEKGCRLVLGVPEAAARVREELQWIEEARPAMPVERQRARLEQPDPKARPRLAGLPVGLPEPTVWAPRGGPRPRTARRTLEEAMADRRVG